MSCVEPAGAPLGNDRLLSVADVCNIMGFCPETASKFMKETGCALTLHRRIFILESSLLSFLREQENKEVIA